MAWWSNTRRLCLLGALWADIRATPPCPQVPILAGLPSLQHLSLQGNPCCSQPDYALQLFTSSPHLLTLDGMRRGAAPHTQVESQVPTAPPAPVEQRQPLAEVANTLQVCWPDEASTKAQSPQVEQRNTNTHFHPRLCMLVQFCS